MAIITDYEHAWRYATQNGFTTKPGQPGWIPAAQRDMATIEHLIERMSGGYPCQVITKFYHNPEGFRFPWLSTINVKGKHGKLFCDLESWRSPSPENTSKAHIRYCTVYTPEDLEGDHRKPFEWKPVYRYDYSGDEPMWETEALDLIKDYLTRFEALNPTWHVDIWESGLGGTIERPDFSGESLIVQLEYHDWED